MGEKKGALNVEQSRNVRNGSGATGRHISTDAAINQKKAAQKKSAAAKRRGKKAVNSVKQAAKKPAAKKQTAGKKTATKTTTAKSAPANRQAAQKQNLFFLRPDPVSDNLSCLFKGMVGPEEGGDVPRIAHKSERSQGIRKMGKLKINMFSFEDFNAHAAQTDLISGPDADHPVILIRVSLHRPAAATRSV